MSNQIKIGLVIWFYIGWFGCVFLAPSDFSQLSLIFPALPLLVFLKNHLLSRKQWQFLFLISTVGIIFDFCVFHWGFVKFNNHDSAFLPIWLIAIWLLFSTVFFASQNLFKEKVILASLLGFIFGPLSYLSGESFGVLVFTSPLTIWLYAIFWAAFFPGIHLMSRSPLWK